MANGTDLLESPSEPLGFKHVERFRASSLAHCCEQRTEKAKVPALSSNETSPASLARDEWYSAVVQASRVRSAVAHAVGVRVPAAPLRLAQEVHPFGAKLEVTPETGEARLARGEDELSRFGGDA